MRLAEIQTQREILLQNEKKAYIDFLEESGLNEDDPDEPGIMQGIKDFLRGFAPKPDLQEAEAQ